jgi:glycerol-3-phosphate acyltransferase PlsY
MVDSVTAAELAGLGAVAYLIGSFPSGLIVGRASGIDIRAVGSGNIGATNVARSLGKRLGAVVLVLDAVKGAFPVGAVLLFDLAASVHAWAAATAGIGAIVGHCFPIWLRFHGGKGVATSMGVFAVLAPEVTWIAIAIWLAFYVAFRIASIGSITAAIAFPALIWAFDQSTPVFVLSLATAAIVITKHHGNIRRLLRREELRI